MRGLTKRPVLLALCALMPAAAQAQDAFSTDGTRGSVTPYLWALSVDGDASVGPLSTDIDVSFSDLLEDLNFALMVEGEYWNGRWGVMGNLLYSDLSDTRTGPLSISADINMTIIGAAAAYRLGPFEGAGNRSVFDAYVGLRYTTLDVELEPAVGPSASRKLDFTDPVIGGRFISEIGPTSRMVIGGDVGGFGVGSDSSWQAIGLYARDVELGKTPATLSVGYRALGQDYTTGGAIPLTIDIVYHGPVAALTFKF